MRRGPSLRVVVGAGWLALILAILALHPDKVAELVAGMAPYALLVVVSLLVWAIVFVVTVGLIILARRRQQPRVGKPS